MQERRTDYRAVERRKLAGDREGLSGELSCLSASTGGERKEKKNCDRCLINVKD